jgi:hypothetical protein
MGHRITVLMRDPARAEARLGAPAVGWHPTEEAAPKRGTRG